MDYFDILQIWDSTNDNSSKGYFEDLCEHIKNNSVIPFVGAGMSIINSDQKLYPQWPDLVKDLFRNNITREDEIQKPELVKETKKYIKSNDLPNALENIKSLVDHVFNDRIKSTFSVNRLNHINMPSKLTILPLLFKNFVITTNLDRCLEKVYNDENLELPVILPRNTPDLGAKHIALKKAILKIHGDYAENTSWVLTQSEYDAVYNKENDDNFLFHLKTLMTNTLLFLGCSLFNDKTIDILGQIVMPGREIYHYAFLPSIDNHDKRIRRERELINKYRIRPIWYPIINKDYNTPIEALLYELLERKVDCESDRLLLNSAHYYFKTRYESINIDSDIFASLVGKDDDKDEYRKKNMMPPLACLIDDSKTNLQITTHSNLSLTGDVGGIGKTYAMLGTFKYYLTYLDNNKVHPSRRVIPLYIPLCFLNNRPFQENQTYISDYLSNHYGIKSLLEIIQSNTHIAKLVLLLDGLNEINDKRFINMIDRELALLNDVAAHNKKLTIIISNRKSISSDYEAPYLSTFKEYILSYLSPPQQRIYLSNHGIHYDSLNEKMKEIINTPFYITLFIKIYSQVNNIHQITSKAQFLHTYLFAEIGSYRSSNGRYLKDESVVMYELIITKLLPHIAYYMDMHNKLRLTKSELYQMLSNAAAFYTQDGLNANILPENKTIINIAFNDRSSNITNNLNLNDAFQILMQNQVFLKNNQSDDSLLFTHENYRDFLSGYHIFNMYQLTLAKLNFCLLETDDIPLCFDNLYKNDNYMSEYLCDLISNNAGEFIYINCENLPEYINNIVDAGVLTIRLAVLLNLAIQCGISNLPYTRLDLYVISIMISQHLDYRNREKAELSNIFNYIVNKILQNYVMAQSHLKVVNEDVYLFYLEGTYNAHNKLSQKLRDGISGWLEVNKNRALFHAKQAESISFKLKTRKVDHLSYIGKIYKSEYDYLKNNDAYKLSIKFAVNELEKDLIHQIEMEYDIAYAQNMLEDINAPQFRSDRNRLVKIIVDYYMNKAAKNDIPYALNNLALNLEIGDSSDICTAFWYYLRSSKIKSEVQTYGKEKISELLIKRKISISDSVKYIDSISLSDILSPNNKRYLSELEKDLFLLNVDSSIRDGRILANQWKGLWLTENHKYYEAFASFTIVANKKPNYVIGFLELVNLLLLNESHPFMASDIDKITKYLITVREYFIDKFNNEQIHIRSDRFNTNIADFENAKRYMEIHNKNISTLKTLGLSELSSDINSLCTNYSYDSGII